MNNKSPRRPNPAKLTSLLLLLAFLSSSNFAQAKYTPTPNNLAARHWFQDARFGLFIHWGVYSVLEDGEWVMHNTKLTLEEYEKLPARFNPDNYDPAQR